MDALIMCAIDISNTRCGKRESTCALAFLDFLTEERLVLLSMLADAVDQCMTLTLATESEDYDVGELTTTINTFIAAVDALFVQKQATTCGYTKPCYKHLAPSVSMVP